MVFRFNGMNWKFFVGSLVVLFSNYFVPVCESSKTDNQTDYLINEWNALGSLSGVRSFSHLTKEYCLPVPQSQPVVTKTQHNLPARAPFYESEYLATPLHVNIIEQICRISSGLEPSVPAVPVIEYNLIHTGAHICQPTVNPVDLLILINSSPKNVIRRNALRASWANQTAWFGAHVRYVFLLDNPLLDSEQIDEMLAVELAHHRDIVQTDLDSDYLNGTMKLIFGFRWSLAFCPQAKWLLFVRDDYTVNPYNTISFLISISEAMRRRLIAGNVWDDPFKIHVNYFLYPGRNLTTPQHKGRYQTFVATSAMLVGSVLAPSLYCTMRFTEYIDQPDLFFAAVMHKLFIIPAHVARMYAYTRRPMSEEHKVYAIAYIE